ncbi:hypothetical protein BD626DRAFT_511216 [Schizophyllum amplum]|uniref:C2H2-type domain-containing protein n=1 Tax=Schizophyllum amplum TaxID=97359 RepID=A0A550C117_9AGAR|nr:hypothetical protein BD626DRAFT_511216 [Auriculariopsis ampla]
MSVQSPPPAISDSAAASLLSLSIAASHAAPIQVSDEKDGHLSVDSAVDDMEASYGAVSGSLDATHQGLSSVSVSAKNRRLSSVTRGKRLSDAREAALRPSPAGSLSLSSLSLSSSPGLSNSPAPRSASDVIAVPAAESAQHDTVSAPIAIGHGKHAKKRGMEYKCESCSKVYRHPSCLIKHRWEHTPHWREASKYVLSKHQQVQLLEAAAILSHISPAAQGGASLPEDRSLWPSFLSGGSLPRAEADDMSTSASPGQPPHTSTSVPIGRAGSTGPRLHDYAIPEAAGGITHLRPGIVGVPTGPLAVEEICLSPFGVTSAPVRVPPASAPAQAWGHGRRPVNMPSSLSRSYSGSGSASDDDESIVVDIDGESSEGPYLGDGGKFDRSAAGYLGERDVPRYAGDRASYVGEYGYYGMAGYMKTEEDEDAFSMRQDAVKPAVKQQDEWGGMDVDMDMD